MYINFWKTLRSSIIVLMSQGCASFSDFFIQFSKAHGFSSLSVVFTQSIQQDLDVAQDEITCFRISGTWRKHATPCFHYVYVKVVRFRCIRSNGNARKRHETGNGNTGYPLCFRNGLTCFCHVSVYGFLQFRPVMGGS